MKRFLASALGRLLMIALVAGAILFAVNRCQAARQADTKAELATEQGKAGSAAASGAIETVGGVADRAQDSDDLTRSNEDEIRNAPGADQAVDPGVRDTWHDVLCRRAAYRNLEQCVRQPDP